MNEDNLGVSCAFRQRAGSTSSGILTPEHAHVFVFEAFVGRAILQSVMMLSLVTPFFEK